MNRRSGGYTGESDAEGERVSYRGLICVCGVFASTIGLVALAGWSLRVTLLASLGIGRIPMAPSTAVLFVLYGFTVVARALAPHRRGALWFGAAVHFAGTTVTLLLLLCSLLGIYPEVEHLGFAVGPSVQGSPVGHMSPATAFGFLAVGLSFLASLPSASASRPRQRAGAAWCLAWALFAVFLVVLLAYLYGTPLMYGGRFVPPAVTTAMAFAALGLALLALAGPQVWQRGELAADGARSESVLLLVFVTVAGGIVTAGYLYFTSYQTRFRVEVEREVSSIADLKASELVQYRNERLGDALLLTGNRPFSSIVARALRDPADRHARLQLRAWLRKYQAHYQYDRVSLLDTQGVQRMWVPEAPVPVAAVVAQRVPEILRSRQVVIQDFHRNENDQRVYLTVLLPIFHGRGRGHPLGVLALRIDPEDYLYPFLRRWPTPTETAEVLLVRRDGDDVVFLNDARFREDSALSLRIPLTSKDVPSVQAVLGKRGILEGIDYRGQPVIADARAIPDSPWIVVARMDVSEAYAPLRERMWATVVLVGVLLAGAGGSVWGVWRQQRARFYRERYEAERDRAWLQDVVARSLNEVYVFDQETLRFSFANLGACRNIGYTTEELAGLTPLDIKPDLTEEAFRDMLQPLRSGAREVLVFDAVHRRKDGSRYPVEVHLQLVKSDGEKVFLAVINDITERKRADAALQRQRDLYDMLAQTNQAIVRCTNQDELFEVLCRVAVEHGRFAFAWVGLADANVQRVVPVAKHGDDAGYVSGLVVSTDPTVAEGRGPMGQAFQTGRHTVSNRFMEDPRTAPWHDAAGRAGIRASAAFPLSQRGTVVGGVSLYSREADFFTADVLDTLDEMVNDVSFALDNFLLETERTRALEALRESEYRYRDLVENSQDLICTHDLSGRLLSVNDAAVKASGYPREVLLGVRIPDLLTARFRERFEAYVATLRDEGRARGVVRLQMPDAEPRFWEYDNTLRAEREGEPVVRAMCHDVTERLSAERQRLLLETQLRAAQKMEALGTLAGGIAHDFNNILGAIIGNVALAREDVGVNHPAIESLDEIRKASNRAKELVQRILAFGRQQQQPQTVISLRPVVEEAIKLLRAILPSGVELVTSFDPNTPTVLADPTDVHQVLINLCTNAWQALIGQTGRIEICLDAVTLDAEQAAVHPDLRAGRYARLSVVDAGSGMDAATVERMFEPFFTTKSVGQGTGLGLSVVHGIAKAHGAAIEVTTKPGAGTTIRVYFPAVDAPASDPATAGAVAAPVAVASGQRVLYVDDEEALVFLVTRTLERMGFRVSGYTRALDAIAAVRADPAAFDLVITDFNMPGLSGLEVARELSRLRPDLPVMLASGYITDVLRAQALEAGVRELIYKPNTVEELCAAVQRLAAASRPA